MSNSASIDVRVTDTLVYDFLCSILRLHNNDRYTPDQDANQDIHDWAVRNLASVPDDLKEKARVFFSLETSFALTLTDVVRDSGAQDVPAFIAALQESPAEELLSRFLYTGAGPGRDVSAALVTSLGTDQNAAYRFVQENLTYGPQEKWQVMGFLLDQEGTKKDLISVLRWHYDEIYRKDEEETARIIATASEELKRSLSYDKELLHLVAPYDKEKPPQSLTIALSYYFEKGMYLNVMDSIYILGYSRLEELMGKHSVSVASQVFKALSDKTRLQILKLLLQRAWYGHELAQELGLSNSTVTHHLVILTVADLVKARRVENRVYYELDVKNARQAVIDAVDRLFRE